MYRCAKNKERACALLITELIQALNSAKLS